jgi:hypothetical protein
MNSLLKLKISLLFDSLGPNSMKHHESLQINSINSDFNNLFFSSNHFNSKINNKLGGNDANTYIDNTVNFWTEKKNNENFLLEKKKKSFFERVIEVLDNISPNLVVPRDDISDYSEEDLLRLLRECKLDAYSYATLSRDISDINNSKRRIRSFENRIKCILGNIRKKLRNYKEIFRRQHSFHFKNMDDYHALTLINKVKLIKV